jgi:hypothetical protein
VPFPFYRIPVEGFSSNFMLRTLKILAAIALSVVAIGQ